jgi:two-component system cell cycle sensor histidine kinase/response regulator CckA
MPGDQVFPAVILVVDDEEVVARLVGLYLAHIGYTVLEARSGEQALAIVQQRQPPIDLVLSDAAMRGMDGTEFAAAVLAECPAPELILVTGPLLEACERVDVQGHWVRVLRKPLDLDVLQDLLQMLLPTLLPAEECETVRPAD